MATPTLATHWMIVANSTLNEAVSHDSYHPIWKKFVSNLLNFRQALSCTVCRGILEEAYSPMPPSYDHDCQHHTCKSCLGKKKSLRPPCSLCRDYSRYVRCTLIDNHVRSYENLCEYLRQSRQYPVIKNEKIVDATASIALPESLRDSRGLCVEKLVNEIMMLSGSGGGGIVIRDRPLVQMNDDSSDLSDENISKDVDCLGSDFGSPSGSDGKDNDFGMMDFTSYSSSLNDEDDHGLMIGKSLGHEHEMDFLTGSLDDVNEQPSFMFKDDVIPGVCGVKEESKSVFNCEGSIMVSTSPPRIASPSGLNGNLALVKSESTVMSGSSVVTFSASLPAGYSSLALTGPCVALNGDLPSTAVASTSSSCPEVLARRPGQTMLLAIKTPPRLETSTADVSGALLLPSTSGSVSGSQPTSSMLPPGCRSRQHPSKAAKSRKGCRCGTATNNPGTLTCCGQRCPCYVEAKECIECKCRGCRNPYRSGGRKVRPHIVPTENIQVHFPPSPKQYVKSVVGPGAAAAVSASTTPPRSQAQATVHYLTGDTGSLNVNSTASSGGNIQWLHVAAASSSSSSSSPQVAETVLH